MVSNIPVARAASAVKTNESAKDSILFTIQIALKQLQQCCTVNNVEDCLSLDNRDLLQLCDGLDKALLHGLRECQQGYWPILKEFTHKDTISFLENLESTCTEIQYGRAWLCLALNESSLESYFLSFYQNPYLIKKYYISPALLRDQERVQLLLMLVAALENVPINISVKKTNFGSGLSFLDSDTYQSVNRVSSRSSSDFSLLSIFNSSRSNLQDDDSGVIGCESAIEITDDVCNLSDVKFSDTGISEYIEYSNNCKLSVQELERITKYINLLPENATGVSEDLEVVRTKVVRRLKKKTSQNNSSQNDEEDQFKKSVVKDVSNQSSVFESCNDMTQNRLSKATTDSGLSLETHCSSDSESPETGDENVKQTVSFNVSNFHHEINVTFSTPQKTRLDQSNSSEVNIEEKKDFLPECENIPCVEERGVPEGQEDPVISQNCSDRLPLQPGNDGLEDGEEEISIYDMSKSSYFVTSDQKVLADDDDSEISNKCTKSLETEVSFSVSSSMKLEKVDPVLEEIEKASDSRQKDLDFRLDSNTILYLVVEVCELEDEVCQKMYYGYFAQGRGNYVLLLLTNKCLYVLKPGSQDQKFLTLDSVMYSNIDYITVCLNYQGFTVICKNYKQKLSFYTADELLTRSILSNLEVIIRRFHPKLSLPCVITDGALQSAVLRRFLSAELGCEKEEIELYHYVLVNWSDYDGSSSPPITPAGPRREGFLMYRHIFSKSKTATTWQPGFFVLKAGVLYCMDEDRKKPLFFIQICVPHCRGCRRVYLLNRPHAFEVILSNGDSLQIAGADEYEASVWQQSFLQTVSLAGHFIDSEEKKLNPCFLVIANDYAVVAVESFSPQRVMKSLAKANICNLIAVFVDPNIANFILMEFEIAEAGSSTGEWIVFFDAEIEKEKFLEVVQHIWHKMHQADLQISIIRDLSLRKRCTQFAQEMVEKKEKLQELCYES